MPVSQTFQDYLHNEQCLKEKQHLLQRKGEACLLSIIRIQVSLSLRFLSCNQPTTCTDVISSHQCVQTGAQRSDANADSVMCQLYGLGTISLQHQRILYSMNTTTYHYRYCCSALFSSLIREPHGSHQHPLNCGRLTCQPSNTIKSQAFNHS